jgi:hypothetical protein
VYLIARGEGMRERRAQAISNAEEMQRAYFQKIVGASSADELSKLADLKKKGVLTDAEFNAQKAKLLS